MAVSLAREGVKVAVTESQRMAYEISSDYGCWRQGISLKLGLSDSSVIDGLVAKVEQEPGRLIF